MAQLAKYLVGSDICILLYRQALGFASVSEQLADLRSFTAHKQFKEVALFDLSEANRQTKIHDLLISFCKKQQAKTIVCWRLDCLSNATEDFHDFAALIMSLQDHGIRFLSVKDSVDSESSAKAFFKHSMMAWDHLKKSRKIEIARASAIKAKARGSHLGKFKVRDDQAIRALRKKGLSLREIAVKTGVSTSAVQRALKNQDHCPARSPEIHT